MFLKALHLLEITKDQNALKYFICFAAAKLAITYALDIMTTIFTICGGVVLKVTESMGSMTSATFSLPSTISDAIDSVGFWGSIPLWLVTILGSLFITIMSFIMIMTVYGRFFKLYMYTALAPVPLSSFAGESTSSIGKAFIKSYVGVRMEGAVIVLACLIFSAFISSGTPTADVGRAIRTT